MSESSPINDLIHKIQDVAAQHGTRKVASVRVLLGALYPVSADDFHEQFKKAAANSVAEGATLEVVFNSDPDDAHAEDILLDNVAMGD